MKSVNSIIIIMLKNRIVKRKTKNLPLRGGGIFEENDERVKGIFKFPKAQLRMQNR